MDKKYTIWKTGYYILCLMLSLQLVACSEESHDEYTAATAITDTYIDQLDALIAEMTTLQKSADYGEKAGQYPMESRAILTDAIDDANRAVLLIKYQNPAPLQSEKERYASNAEKAMQKFKDSVRDKDAETIPAELFVDGKGANSYIDFGRHKEYVQFGEQGNQAFTIEFWVKMTERGGHDNSIFLSTFCERGGDPRFRNGWMMYWRKDNNGIYRTTLGAQTSNDHFGLWEPGASAPEMGQWHHFAFVYNDKGLNGNTGLRGLMFIDGVQKAEVNSGDSYNSADFGKEPGDKPMTAFCRWMNGDNKMEEGLSGYMKNVRIWKVAKDQTYITQSKNGEISLTGKEDGLVAGWNFTTKPSGAANEILDITGKFTAKVIGTYKWERVKE